MAINRFVLITFLSFGLSLFVPISSLAVHKGAGDLVCGNCHTMHSSQGGTNGMSMGGASGSFILLRTSGSSLSSRAEIHKLCLQCHASNGTQADVVHAPQGVIAPKVYSSATWTGSENQAFRLIGAGGNFAGELNASWDNTDGTTNANKLGKGHSLGATSVTPPGGESDPQISEFTCTNCHDPHGTSNTADNNTNIFRNLKVNATGAGANSGVKFYTGAGSEYYKMKSYVGGVNGTYFGGLETDSAGKVIWPVYTGTLDGDPVLDSGKTNSYGTGDDVDSFPTMSKWCAQCHDKWHEDIQGTNKLVTTGPDDRFWYRHPVNTMVPRASTAGCAGTCHTSMLDRSNYTTAVIQAGKGLPVTSSNIYSGYVYYLPFSTTGTGFGGMDSLTTAAGSHKVFCLTCHFAHGGPYYDNLRWDYTSAVSSGSQNGNGVPSNVGCQLCHNR